MILIMLDVNTLCNLLKAIVISSCWLKELYFGSVLQSLVASSTINAEFITCYKASDHGTWL